MSVSPTLTDFLKKLDAEDSPVFPDPEKILKFKCTPLLAIMLQTELHSTLQERDYRGVFIDDDNEQLTYNSQLLKHSFSEPEFQEIHDQALDIIQYFREILTLKKLRGMELSSYEDNLSEFISLSERYSCKVKHLPLAVKLPEFYQVEQAFLNMTEELESFKCIDKTNEILCIQSELTPLGVWFKSTKREKKEITYLHFKTQDNNLVEYKARKSDILSELFRSESFKECKLNAKLYGTTETHPLSGFTYFRPNKIEIDS